ncbi:MAG: hypothetical protein F6K56_20150 [Moorea sp. SIO3G5]|nr:hypothetical protein [Moorena sp. SIO3G5]
MKRFSRPLKAIFAFLMAVQLFLMVSPAAIAQEMPAVISPDGICTRDYNPCGNSSICACPDGYEYDANVGYCLIDDIYQATSRGFDAISVNKTRGIPHRLSRWGWIARRGLVANRVRIKLVDDPPD